MSHLLSIDQKHVRLLFSQTYLDRFDQNKMDFKRHFITVDETWIHHYRPEQKHHTKQWIEGGGSELKKPKAFRLTGKFSATIFCDYKGMLWIAYLQ